MCAIVDASVASLFFNDPVDPELAPLWSWINQRQGGLAIGGKLLADEYEKVASAIRAVRNWERAGLAHIIPDSDIESEREAIEDQCVSNDAHIVALARVSGARILCSSDRPLHQDFRDPGLINAPRGSVYQNTGHQHLLDHHGKCPLLG